MDHLGLGDYGSPLWIGKIWGGLVMKWGSKTCEDLGEGMGISCRRTSKCKGDQIRPCKPWF